MLLVSYAFQILAGFEQAKVVKIEDFKSVPYSKFYYVKPSSASNNFA